MKNKNKRKKIKEEKKFNIKDKKTIIKIALSAICLIWFLY